MTGNKQPEERMLAEREDPSGIGRRSFLRGATAAAAFSIVPRHVLGGSGNMPPSEKPALAGVGVGGVGHGQLKSCDRTGHEIVALCDVDDEYAKKSYDHWPDARQYRDFRRMLDEEDDRIDAVYIGVPDHTHAVITLEALRRGKHVCCVKPLTRTVHEGRVVLEATEKADVATQVTASPATTERGCRTCEMIWDGAIGDVLEVHIWSNRPMWPQGMQRPKGSDPIPDTFDWDLWLGPMQRRPFRDKWPDGHLALEQIECQAGPNTNPNSYIYGAIYHPWNFRGWVDFGTGALGDMGCHHFNIPKRALKLNHPTAVHASATRVFNETWPLSSIVTWEFPPREGMPAARINWYDGGLKPPRPEELEDGRELPDAGIIYVGTEGKMMGTWGGVELIPESRQESYNPPPKMLERRSGTWGEWMEAIRGGQPAGCNFEYAVPLTEIVLLGNIAIRTGQYLKWDGEAMKFTNNRDANDLLGENYRGGWSLEG